MKEQTKQDHTHVALGITLVVLLCLGAVAFFAFFAWYTNDEQQAKQVAESHTAKVVEVQIAPDAPGDKKKPVFYDPLATVRKPLAELLRERANERQTGKSENLTAGATGTADPTTGTAAPTSETAIIFYVPPGIPEYGAYCVIEGSAAGYNNMVSTCGNFDFTVYPEGTEILYRAPFVLTDEAESPTASSGIIPTEYQTGYEVYGITFAGNAVLQATDWATMTTNKLVNYPWYDALGVANAGLDWFMATGMDPDGNSSGINCKNFCSTITPALRFENATGVTKYTTDAFSGGIYGFGCYGPMFYSCVAIAQVPIV